LARDRRRREKAGLGARRWRRADVQRVLRAKRLTIRIRTDVYGWWSCAYWLGCLQVLVNISTPAFLRNPFRMTRIKLYLERMWIWTALFLLLAASLQAGWVVFGYTILTRTTSATHYATTGRLNSCNETIIFSCPDGAYVFNGLCTLKTVWLEKTPAQWFRAPEWLVPHATPSGITASCPPGSLRGWTGSFVAYFDVYPEPPPQSLVVPLPFLPRMRQRLAASR